MDRRYMERMQEKLDQLKDARQPDRPNHAAACQ